MPFRALFSSAEKRSVLLRVEPNLVKHLRTAQAPSRVVPTLERLKTARFFSIDPLPRNRTAAVLRILRLGGGAQLAVRAPRDPAAVPSSASPMGARKPSALAA